MSETIIVRDMLACDIALFGRMLGDMVAESPRCFSVTPDFAYDYGSNDAFMSGMEKAISQNKVGRFVALNESDVVGGVTCSIKDETVRIGNMYVRPEHRGKGIGRVLLGACEARAIMDGYFQTSLVVANTNNSARKFYTNHDYAPSVPPQHEYWDIHDGVFGELLVKSLR